MIFQGHFPTEPTWSIWNYQLFLALSGASYSLLREDVEGVPSGKNVKPLRKKKNTDSSSPSIFCHLLTTLLLTHCTVLDILASQSHYAIECLASRRYTTWRCGQLQSDSSDPAPFSPRCPFRGFHSDLQPSTLHPCHQPFEAESRHRRSIFKRFCPDGVWGTIPFISLLLPPILYPSSAPTAACPT